MAREQATSIPRGFLESRCMRINRVINTGLYIGRPNYYGSLRHM
ncbi:hypothetical protein [Desulfurococcus mucosus]|nr:hypothetical protein [Desulfurococcus mucosus]